MAGNDSSSLDSLSTDDLQQKASELRLSTDGSREDLVQRIKDHYLTVDQNLAEARAQAFEAADQAAKTAAVSAKKKATKTVTVRKRKVSSSSSSSSSSSDPSDSDGKKKRRKRGARRGRKRRASTSSSSSSSSSSESSSDDRSKKRQRIRIGEFSKENTRKQAKPLIDVDSSLRKAAEFLRRKPSSKDLAKAKKQLRKARKYLRHRLDDVKIADVHGWEVVEEMNNSAKLPMGRDKLKCLHRAQQTVAAKRVRGKDAKTDSTSAGTSGIRQGSQPFRSGLGGNRGSGRGPCYNCGKDGHLARDRICVAGDVQQHQKAQQSQAGGSRS